MLSQAGVYTLIIHLPANIRLKVGKLGEHQFSRGYYAYTGSALGLGASSLRRRVARHLQKKKHKFWHIDHLLTRKDAVVIVIIAAQTSEKVECEINRRLRNEITTRIPVLGFGLQTARKTVGVTFSTLVRKMPYRKMLHFITKILDARVLFSILNKNLKFVFIQT